MSATRPCKHDCGRLASPPSRECHPCRNRRYRAKERQPLVGSARQISELKAERIGDSLRAYYQDHPEERARLSREMTARIQAGFRCGEHNRKVDASKLAAMRAQRATGATLAQIAKSHGLSEYTCWHYLKGTTTSKHGPRRDISDRHVASLRHTGLSLRHIAQLCKCSKSTILARLSRSGKAAA